MQPSKPRPESSYSREGLRRANRIREFLRRHIVHTEGVVAGKPFILEKWQWLNQILPLYGTLDRKGHRKYKRALWGVPRWHDKSTTASALSLAHLAVEPIMNAEEFAVATTIPQAGKIFGIARQQSLADPLLSRLFSVKANLIKVRDTGATFRVLPHNADTAQGFHPPFVALDEMHVYKNERLINAMISGSIGFDQPIVLGITTAAERRGVILDEIRKRWAKDPNAYVYWSGAEDGDDPHDPETWMRANPASWITYEKLLACYQTMPLSEFMRYHLNLAPKASAERVYPADRWWACDARPIIDPDRPCVIAVDASLRRDHTAVVLDQVDRDGWHNWLSWTFTPEEDQSIMSAVDHDVVGDLLRELAASFNVRRIPCDRAYFVRTMRDLLDEGLPVEEFGQSNQNMGRACQTLFDVLAEGRARHGGDPELTEHVLNASYKSAGQYGFRITKPSEFERIDACVALAMATDIAEVEARDSGILASVG